MQESSNIGDRWASSFSVDPAEVEAEFDAEAVKYDQNLDAWDYRVPEDGTKILAEHVSPSAKLLDAGCGTGLIGAASHRLGYSNLFGCDLSRAMLEVAKSKEIYQELVHADLCQRLPYDDDAFDAVTCLATLSFIEDAEPTFREFCRITRRDGIICFSHREDLFLGRDCLGLCQRLEGEGLWMRESHSDWQAYIPGHPAYTDRLRVGYFVYRVQTTGSGSAS